MAKSGIYQLTNTVNGKFYIGQSSNVDYRSLQHFYSLRPGRHSNRHLQSAFNKYGEEAFQFRILLYCEPHELTRYEQMLTDRRNPEYAVRFDCVTSNRGIRHSDETRRRMSLAQKGKVVTKETIQRMIQTKLAACRKISEDTRRRMSLAQAGRRHSEETKASISKTLTGHTFSQETREKISNTLKGNILSPETRGKISKALLGRELQNKGKTTGIPAWNKGITTGRAAWNRGKAPPPDVIEKLRGRVPWNKGRKTGPLSDGAKRKMAIAQRARRERERIERETP